MTFTAQSEVREDGRVCVRCEKFKPWEEFQVYARGLNGRRAACSLCLNGAREKYADSRAEYMFGYRLRRNFNITLEQYLAIEAQQGGVCKLCRQPETWVAKPSGKVMRLAIDHDHRCCSGRSKSCGKCIRGLLCNRCNYLVGLAESEYGLLVFPQLPAYVNLRVTIAA